MSFLPVKMFSYDAGESFWTFTGLIVDVTSLSAFGLCACFDALPESADI